MLPMQNSRLWKARLFTVAILSAVLLGASARSAVSEICALNDKEAPDELIFAVQKLQDGDYLEFVSAIESKGRLPPDSSLALASDLEDYAADGFELCTVAKEEIGSSSQSYFLVFKDGSADNERVIFVFFMLAKMREDWLFLKTQVSTNFDEVYEFVR
jgi:hypothetical protein